MMYDLNPAIALNHARVAALSIVLFTTLLSSSGQAASPRINYLLHCSGCHLPGGEGAPPNVPTMHGELGRMLSVAPMREYLVRVPGSAQSSLSDAELAEVVNWLLEEFNSGTLPPDFKPLTTDEVSAARKQILADPLQYRITHWRNYNFNSDRSSP